MKKITRKNLENHTKQILHEKKNLTIYNLYINENITLEF